MLRLQAWGSVLVRLLHTIISGTGVFARDVLQGMLHVSHNALALMGLLLVLALVVVVHRQEARRSLESHLFTWLNARHEARLDPSELLASELNEPGAIARATALDVRNLPRSQAAVAVWLSRRYKVAPEPVSRIVKEAWFVGEKAKLDPTLILAIMALESGFNPFAQSPMGAQGLMQVMTRVHNEKYQGFGGHHAAFDPITNLRVGVQVLKECIARAGSLEAGLKFYVGAANLNDDNGYAQRVLAEQHLLRLVAQGRTVAVATPLPPVTPNTTSAPPLPNTPAAAPPAASSAQQLPHVAHLPATGSGAF